MLNKEALAKEFFSFRERDGRYRLFRVDRRTKKLVEVLSNPMDKGYALISYAGKTRKYHHIVWVLENGEIPKGSQIDHIDGNRSNNDINNLRLVTNKQNQYNTYKHREGHLVGTCKPKGKNFWVAYIRLKEVGRIHIGTFKSAKHAHAAYQQVHKAWYGTLDTEALK